MFVNEVKSYLVFLLALPVAVIEIHCETQLSGVQFMKSQMVAPRQGRGSKGQRPLVGVGRAQSPLLKKFCEM